jgi:hypothetical protein
MVALFQYTKLQKYIFKTKQNKKKRDGHLSWIIAE